MNPFNLIIIGLIFLSLTIIVVVFGRSLGRVKKIDTGEVRPKIKKGKDFFVFRFFGFIWGGLKAMLVSLAEWIVKKVKKVLHLIHFWLIKVKKKKSGNGVTDELEAKKELILQEEQNLDTVINDDLGSPDEEVDVEEEAKVILGLNEKDKRLPKKEKEIIVEKNIQIGIEAETEIEDIDISAEKEKKIAKFFSWKKKEEPENLSDERDFLSEGSVTVVSEKSEEAIESQSIVESDEKKGGLWSRLKSMVPVKKGDVEGDKEQEESVSRKFSDGVVKIKKAVTPRPKEEFLIKEVVKSNRSINESYDVDDELGVDRKILEKKILQKIAKEPKNIEHYRQLGELYIKMKSFDDANDTYKFILKITPRDADSRRKIEKIKLLKRLN